MTAPAQTPPSEPDESGSARKSRAALEQARTAKRERAGKSSATIYDIAKLAGVNPSTVSRALSKPGRISAKTEKKIQDAARQLNYRANPFARALPTGRTSTIGLIVADITNPVFFDIVRGAEGAAAERDYTLLLAESAESAETEVLIAQRMLASVDGLVLATPRLADGQIQELAAEKPVTVINRIVADVPSVVADLDRGIGEAVRHLAQLGHRQLVFIAGPERSWMSRSRWASIQERCEWSNIAVTRIPGESPTVDGGRRAAAQVRASGATAVIAYNDLMAIGLMQELIGAGLAVPDDISILGFDNIFGADFTTPPLSTIRSPLREEGRSAVRRILDELGDVPGGDQAGEPVELATELVVRGSTGKAPAAV